MMADFEDAIRSAFDELDEVSCADCGATEGVAKTKNDNLLCAGCFESQVLNEIEHSISRIVEEAAENI